MKDEKPLTREEILEMLDKAFAWLREKKKKEAK